MIADAEAFEGKYEILAKIREGGMGAVYKVRHRLLDEIRVIKVIRPHLSTSPEMGERFLREARLAIRVRHPNIAQLHDFSVDPDGTAYIVMEFVDGLSLADVLAVTAPLPPGLALAVAHGALGAIGYLHRRGMIHRDVSPDNLMLGRDEDGQPRITLLDLGIAKSLAGSSALTSTGAFLGKPRYASPEHFGAEGLAGVGPSSDLYSFGVVLYELATGVCPVQGRDTSSWIAGHLFRPPLGFAESDPGGRVPEELRAVLLKALAKAPEDRFASAEEMAGALEPARSRYPVEPDSLERALGALPPEAPPAALPPPGTTQDAFDRRFAPLETPLPRPQGRTPTLVLHPRGELPLPEPPAAPPPTERTQVLSLSDLSGAVEPVEAPAVLDRVEERPRPAEVAAPARPSRGSRLIPALAGVLLLVLAVGIGWWLGRSRETAPEAGRIAESSAAAPGPAASAPPAASKVPESAPEPVEAAPVPAPVISAPAAPPPPVPEVRTEPRARPARSAASGEPPKKDARTESPPVAPAPRQTAPPALSEPLDETPAAEAAPVAPPPPAPREPAAPAPSIQPARALRTPRPDYPESARGSGVHAVVIVAVKVSPDGSPFMAEVRKSMTKRGRNGKPPTPAQALAFQRAAVASALKARFEPATRDGKPIPWEVELVEEFLPE